MSQFYLDGTYKGPIVEVDILQADDNVLEEISRELSIGLSLDEMKNVREHFSQKGRNPSDIELQAIGQAWSEHCCYKSSKVFLKEHVFGIEAPQNMLVISEDAGIVEFDDEHAYALALESHNHPSAIGPYGGAATGIGGIVRDVLCMGAQPIALIDPLFFGPLSTPPEEIPQGTRHPKYLLEGVVSGIRDYGNRIGIPTVGGMVNFHPGYTGNCLVNVGCVGIVRKEHMIRSRVKAAGNIYVLLGGRTGRDGIHGVTFASAELSEGSEDDSRGAVQLGDPITKEPVIHACLEVNERGLLEGMKDLGGGGLSCVCGEMALAAGLGAEIDLDKVPLKEDDMLPWEIWVSESQERMMLAVAPENLEEVLHVCKNWDVEANVIGQVIPEKTLKVNWEGEKVFEMDLEFLTGGPQYCRPYTAENSSRNVADNIPIPPADADLGEILLKLLSSENIASKDWIIRQYDFDVRGKTVIKPLQGKFNQETHGDAAVIKPVASSFRGLALCSDVNPKLMELDPYWGACNAVDEVCRNLVSVGARPHSLADCLNFGNPEKPDRLGDFYNAVRGLGDCAKHLKVPFVSGNVSLYNETAKGAIPPTPTIMGVGIAKDIRKCVTVDFKSQENPVYLVGETLSELGGSAYLEIVGGSSPHIPKVNFDRLKASIDALLEAITSGLVAACHDLSDGGLAVCAAEMCLGGDIGLSLDTLPVGSKDMRTDFKLFSESATRWLVEVKKGQEEAFAVLFANAQVPVALVGHTGGSVLSIDSSISIPLEELRSSWEAPIHVHMGDGLRSGTGSGAGNGTGNNDNNDKVGDDPKEVS